MMLMEELKIPCRCGACDWTGDQTELQPVNNLWERVQQGEVVPAGECPSCGALAYDDSPPCPQAFIAEHVRADVTELVGSIARQGSPYARALREPFPDYETAAREAGWTVRPETVNPAGVKSSPCVVRGTTKKDPEHTQGFKYAETWEHACEFDGIEPHEIPIIGHYIITAELADKLEARGERVERDFGGLIVWARKGVPVEGTHYLWDNRPLDRDPVLLAIFEAEGQ